MSRFAPVTARAGPARKASGDTTAAKAVDFESKGVPRYLGARIHRKCTDVAGCECEGCSGPRIQRRGSGSGAASPLSPEGVGTGLTGQALDVHLRRSIEPLLGYSLADVRIHNDPGSHARARAFHAHAYTIGSHVHFGAGQYRPEVRSGLHLLVHELAHTVQQRGAPAQFASDSIHIDAPDSPLEREADALADAVVAGRRSPVLAGRPAPAPGLRLSRRWDQPKAGDCAGVEGNRWLRKVLVQQESPQNVSLYWSDGSVEVSGASTGKGHCCVDTDDGVACDRARSRTDSSNCTPISSGAEFPISDRRRQHNGWQFWNTFVPARGIALHEHHTVDGTPLSHGCVRLPLETARRIFCGERQYQTKVEVRGFARPRCDSSRLKAEWLGDIQGTNIAGSDGEEYRKIVRDGYGRDLTAQEKSDLRSGKSTLPLPPRCAAARRAPRPTAEEDLGRASRASQPRVVTDPARPGEDATVPGNFAASFPQSLLTESGFEALVPRFVAALDQAGSLAAARQIVRREGRNLWTTATRRAQTRRNADTDDRPLYWARLQLTQAMRNYQPVWTLSAADREALMSQLEDSSRGRDTADFPRVRGAKRILLSGFDPFGFHNGGSLRQSNLSGAAVLALDGRTLTEGGVTAQIQGVIYPVRYADFDAGVVERFLRPHLTGKNPPHLIMSISQGGAKFELEEFAGRRRSTEGFKDNQGRLGGGTRSAPVVAPGLGAGPEFLPTNVPAATLDAMRGTLGRSSAVAGETGVQGLRPGASVPTRLAHGSAVTNERAVEGSGGGFLSNEIFYRQSLLRGSLNSSVPTIHLHTPMLAVDATAAQRDALIDSVQKMLRATLSSL